MRLYSGTCEDFYADVSNQVLTQKLTDAFRRQVGHQPGAPERRSWQNSLTTLNFACQKADLAEQGIILEYSLPYSSKRLDVMFCGENSNGDESALIVELKQWERCEPADGESVVTWVGGGNREVLHPSVQVAGYRDYLADGNSAFHPGEPSSIPLSACAYLHNYTLAPDDPLLDPRFEDVMAGAPIFTQPDQALLVDHLGETVGAGAGEAVLDQALNGENRPSKKLLQAVASMLDGQPEYVLLDEQRIAFDRVIAEAARGLEAETGGIVLIRGGPGTGKSVIALNLLAELANRGLSAHYATGSKAFTTALRKVAGKQASQQFKYFNQYPVEPENSLDVLICDEAHRIRETSVDRWTSKAKRSGKRQVEELMDVSKVSVFFVDDLQVVRPGEVGSADLVREEAEDRGARIFEYELKAQFRCGGSEGFINWVTNTLGIEDTANELWDPQEEFDFRVFESPESLYEAIRTKAAEGLSARMMAGFCWPWSDARPDGTLVEDVAIGDFSAPWNAKSESTGLKKGIPKSENWATQDGGIDQIGCVYTAQGFEFEYAGVIFGTDLVYREGQGWIGQRENSEDRIVRNSADDFVDLVKNTYRVLLTRGIRGCYVHFMDEETERYWQSRISVGSA
jgi:DUF2075 family protein